MSLGTYNGDEKLLFSIDLGTTMSAVAYCHLQPAVEPRINVISRWPGQPHAQGDSKVPSLVAYDKKRVAEAFGAVALESMDGPDDLHLAKWFKLWLHPAAMQSPNDIAVPPLPEGVSIERVYTDFMRYLFDHARDTVENNAVDATLWTRLKDSFVLCLAIPNGWDDAQQEFLRNVAVAANILPADHERDRLQFVSEGESSVHFAISHADAGSWLKQGTVFAVCDAGGSTVDTTLYKCVSAVPTLALQEITASECVQAGGVFVDQEAERIIQKKLEPSRFNQPSIISHIVSEFERKTKRGFDGTTVPAIKFGYRTDNDLPNGVSLGHLKLTSEEVENAFKQPVEAILRSIDNAFSRCNEKCEVLLLVGGFAESPYLRKALGERLKTAGVRSVNIDEPTKKAAVEGAAAWYAKQFVIARAARATYGLDVTRPFDASSGLHQGRSQDAFVSVDGTKKISGLYEPLIKQNHVVQHFESVDQKYFRLFDVFPDDLAAFEVELYRTEQDELPPWLYDETGKLVRGLRFACKLEADLSGLKSGLKPQTSEEGKTFWRVDYRVEIFFGQTTPVCAALVWDEDGKTRKGPVTVLYRPASSLAG